MSRPSQSAVEHDIRNNSAMDRCLTLLSDAWDLMRPDDPSPFTNSGNRFNGKRLAVHCYSWDDSEEQEWNLKWQGVRVRWYKHCGRGAVVVGEYPTLQEIQRLITDAAVDFSDAGQLSEYRKFRVAERAAK